MEYVKARNCDISLALFHSFNKAVPINGKTTTNVTLSLSNVTWTCDIARSEFWHEFSHLSKLALVLYMCTQRDLDYQLIAGLTLDMGLMIFPRSSNWSREAFWRTVKKDEESCTISSRRRAGSFFLVSLPSSPLPAVSQLLLSLIQASYLILAGFRGRATFERTRLSCYQKPIGLLSCLP